MATWWVAWINRKKNCSRSLTPFLFFPTFSLSHLFAKHETLYPWTNWQGIRRWKEKAETESESDKDGTIFFCYPLPHCSMPTSNRSSTNPTSPSSPPSARSPRHSCQFRLVLAKMAKIFWLGQWSEPKYSSKILSQIFVHFSRFRSISDISALFSQFRPKNLCFFFLEERLKSKDFLWLFIY